MQYLLQQFHIMNLNNDINCPQHTQHESCHNGTYTRFIFNWIFRRIYLFLIQDIKFYLVHFILKNKPAILSKPQLWFNFGKQILVLHTSWRYKPEIWSASWMKWPCINRYCNSFTPTCQKFSPGQKGVSGMDF